MGIGHRNRNWWNIQERNIHTTLILNMFLNNWNEYTELSLTFFIFQDSYDLQNVYIVLESYLWQDIKHSTKWINSSLDAKLGLKKYYARYPPRVWPSYIISISALVFFVRRFRLILQESMNDRNYWNDKSNREYF